MTEDAHYQVTLAKDNVFEDLGFETQEAISLQVKTDLMLNVRSYIQQKGWTQQEAAGFLGETQLVISNLMNGELSQFSIDKLINLLGKMGMEVKIEVVSKVLS